MKSPGAIAAFFDLDRTLLAKSSGELYIRALRERKLVGNRDLAWILATTVLYGLNVVKPERLMDKAASWYRGEPEQAMIDFCEDWFSTTVRNYLYTEAIRRVRDHQERGHVVSLLTAATSYIAEPVRRHLGMSHALCNRMEVRDGRFTGRLVKPLCHGKGKLHWAIAFCRDHGAQLEKSYFYTDSFRDLPTLEAVGNPRPVNPDRPLLRIARKRGWPVERFKSTVGRVNGSRGLRFFRTRGG